MAASYQASSCSWPAGKNERYSIEQRSVPTLRFLLTPIVVTGATFGCLNGRRSDPRYLDCPSTDRLVFPSRPVCMSRREKGDAVTEPTTQTLDVPRATLTYDVRRNDSTSEPIRLMIASPMGAAGFDTLSKHFADLRSEAARHPHRRLIRSQ
jgi:hypothetical protein